MSPPCSHTIDRVTERTLGRRDDDRPLGVGCRIKDIQQDGDSTGQLQEKPWIPVPNILLPSDAEIEQPGADQLLKA
jgi:hypothetical protein